MLLDFSLHCFIILLVTISSKDGNTSFKGFLVEVFTDQPTPNQLKEGEFKVPENAHPTCNGVSFSSCEPVSCLFLFSSRQISLNCVPFFTLRLDFSWFLNNLNALTADLPYCPIFQHLSHLMIWRRSILINNLIRCHHNGVIIEIWRGTKPWKHGFAHTFKIVQ